MIATVFLRAISTRRGSARRHTSAQNVQLAAEKLNDLDLSYAAQRIVHARA